MSSAASFDLNHEDLLIDTYTAGPNCAVRVLVNGLKRERETQRG